jgi:hypothetical protein
VKVTAADIVALLADSTPFAENIVRRQCERLGFELAEVPTSAMPQLVQNVLSVMRQYAEPTAYSIIEGKLRTFLRT